MDNKRVAEKIAEALFRLVEREKRLNKGEFVEVIEKELAVGLMEPHAHPIEQAELPFGGYC